MEHQNAQCSQSESLPARACEVDATRSSTRSLRLARCAPRVRPVEINCAYARTILLAANHTNRHQGKLCVLLNLTTQADFSCDLGARCRSSVINRGVSTKRPMIARKRWRSVRNHVIHLPAAMAYSLL